MPSKIESTPVKKTLVSGKDGPEKAIKKTKKKTKSSFVGSIRKLNQFLNQKKNDELGDKSRTQGMAQEVPVLLNRLAKWILYEISEKQKDLVQRRNVHTINQNDARAGCISIIDDATDGYFLFGQDNERDELADDFKKRFIARDAEITAKVKLHKEKHASTSKQNKKN